MKRTLLVTLGIVLSGTAIAQTRDTPVRSESPDGVPTTTSGSGDDPEVAGILQALRNKDPAVSGPAIMRVKEIGPRVAVQAEAAVPLLVDLWTSQGDQIEKALSAIGAAAIPSLLEALEDKELHRRRAAASSLARHGAKPPPAIPALIKALKDEDADVRCGAARALGSTGRDAREAVPALIGVLNDDDRAVRMAATDALGGIGPEAKEAVGPLVRALNDKEAALTALGRIGRDSEEAVQALTSALQNQSGDIRLSAVSALGTIGRENDAALPALIAALRNDVGYVRSQSVFMLGQIGPRANVAAPALIDALKDQDLREEASIALLRIGPDATSVPALIDLLDHSNLRTRQLAATALSRIGSDAKAAVPALRSNVYYVRAGAAEALGRIGPDAKEAVRALAEALKDENVQVQRHAAEALKRVEEASAKQAGVP